MPSTRKASIDEMKRSVLSRECYRSSPLLLGEPAGLEMFKRLVALNLSMSFSLDMRNLRNDLSWNLQVCAIPSNCRYWGTECS